VHHSPAAPNPPCPRKTSRGPRGWNALSENIEVFDFALSEAEMAEISALGSRDGRLTDFGFSPKWD
jgi:hypothetical protein